MRCVADGRLALGKVDDRRMKVLMMDRDGHGRVAIAEACKTSVPTVFRDLKWLREGVNAELLAERYKPDLREAHVVKSALDAVHVPTAVPHGVAVNTQAGPQGPNERARALEHAARLWRIHIPDPLVALKAFHVDPSLLTEWLAEGRRQICAGETTGWGAMLYLTRAGAFCDSMSGEDGQPGIMSTLFQLMGMAAEEPRVAATAAKLLHEQGAMRSYFTKPIEVRVTAEVPGEAVEGVAAASGLSEALGLIGADA